MVEGNQIYLETAKKMVELFYQQSTFNKSIGYDSGIPCIARYPIARGSKILHNEYHIVAKNDNLIIIIGSFYIIAQSNMKRLKRELMDVTIVFNTDASKITLQHMHISNFCRDENKYQIKDTSERIYNLPEQEILYLEAGHNHVLWHCEHFTIETTGSMKQTEQRLSDTFFKIQRSYIINKKHISKMDRCYIEMDNGEKLPVPVKKYCNVKHSLFD